MSLFKRKPKSTEVPVSLAEDELRVIRTAIRQMQVCSKQIKRIVEGTDGLWEQIKREGTRVIPYVLRQDLEGVIEEVQKTETFRLIYGDGQWLK